MGSYDGRDAVVIYCEAEHSMKELPMSMTTGICDELTQKLKAAYGEEAVKITQAAVKWGTKGSFGGRY